MARRMNLILLAILAVIQLTMATNPPSAKDFFKNKISNGNLTQITWVHAVNDKQKLGDAMKKADVMMLEADVIMGTLHNTAEIIPIMGHPPTNSSDLSLQEFIQTVTNGRNLTKGMKLDFKSIEALEKSMDILKKHNFSVPVWINADILYGPVDALSTPEKVATPVNFQRFLAAAKKSSPNSTLSVGWVTKFGTDHKITEGNYTQKDADAMLDILKDVTQDVTFPVRAALATNSTAVMKHLLAKKPKSTLTIWSPEKEVVDVKKLAQLINTVGVDKVYVDIPKEIYDKLNLTTAGKSGSSHLVSNVVLTLLTSILSAAFVTRML